MFHTNYHKFACLTTRTVDYNVGQPLLWGHSSHYNKGKKLILQAKNLDKNMYVSQLIMLYPTSVPSGYHCYLHMENRCIIRYILVISSLFIVEL